MEMNVSRTIIAVSGFATTILSDGVYMCNNTSLLRNCRSSYSKRAPIHPCGIAAAMLHVTFRRPLWGQAHVVSLLSPPTAYSNGR